MNNFIDKSINYWRSQRNIKMLQSPYSGMYAFVGVGSHALQNLYPILQYLGIKLKYICCKNSNKLPLIQHRFGVTATTSLETILNDTDVKGIFVCTSPQSHFDICAHVISSGKYLFIEKPPCRSLQQLEKLIEEDSQQKVMVGMQKRFSPIVESLKKRISKNEIISYSLSYHTGAYPEGDPFTDLFIHPVDLASYLFGTVQKVSIQRTDHNGMLTVQGLFFHGNVTGLIEFSTAYSWTNSEELLRVNTSSGEYRLSQMERLSFYPHPKKVFSIPIEKIGMFSSSERILVERNNFNPLIENNQLYTQGFFTEIKSFADMVEFSGDNMSPLSSLKSTYNILDLLRNGAT